MVFYDEEQDFWDPGFVVFNLLSPKINIQILHTGIHTFLEKLVERIYF